jgi:hypothetical protein
MARVPNRKRPTAFLYRATSYAMGSRVKQHTFTAHSDEDAVRRSQRLMPGQKYVGVRKVTA